MSVHKFACPHCDQHIEADERYGGMQIQCPACQGQMTIPVVASSPAAPAPTPAVRIVRSAASPAPPAPGAVLPSAGAPLRVTVRSAPAALQPPEPAAAAPPPPRPMTPAPPLFRPPAGDEEPRGSRAKSIVLVAVLVLVAPVAIYYAFAWAGRAQKGFNEARAKDDDPGLVGGELSHIAELNQVLDMTDRMSVRGADEERRGGKGARGAAPAAPVAPVVVPAKWTLDVAAAQIPSGMVAGTLAGSNFVARSVVLYTGGAMPILAFRPDDTSTPDRELLLQLRLKSGEKLEGRTWTLGRDQTGGGPQVVKRWRTNPRVAPQQKDFAGGYALRLEFGQPVDGGLPGKVYVALPDAEQTALGGVFSAEIRVLSMAQGQRRPGAAMSFEE